MGLTEVYLVSWVEEPMDWWGSELSLAESWALETVVLPTLLFDADFSAQIG